MHDRSSKTSARRKRRNDPFSPTERKEGKGKRISTPLSRFILTYSESTELDIEKIRKVFTETYGHYKSIDEPQRLMKCTYLWNCCLYFSALAERRKWKEDGSGFKRICEAAQCGMLKEAEQFLEQIGCRKKEDGTWTKWTASDEELAEADYATPFFYLVYRKTVLVMPAVPSVKALLEEFNEKLQGGDKSGKCCDSIGQCDNLDCEDCILCSNQGNSLLKIGAFQFFMRMTGMEL